jgi:hypothetical protein
MPRLGADVGNNWIAAATVLALALTAGQPATAQTAAVINLSCDGKVKNGAGEEEPVRKMGLVVNLGQHTVSGFTLVARIDRVDDVNVDFSGATTDQLGATSSVIGNIDRVTGAAWIATTLSAKDSKIIGTQAFELVCKVTSRLF